VVARCARRFGERDCAPHWAQLAALVSSPQTANWCARSAATCPVAASIATAVAWSFAAFTDRVDAGAALQVIRWVGKSNPWLMIAARTRSRVSRTRRLPSR
jgi:hypothetical protein